MVEGGEEGAAIAAGFELPGDQDTAGVELIGAVEGQVFKEDAVEADLDEGTGALGEGAHEAEVDTDGEGITGLNVEGRYCNCCFSTRGYLLS